MSVEARLNDESDVEEEALVEDYREQVTFDDGMEELDRSSTGAGQDIQAQLAAAATPLEYQATLETKFASYDNYCNLFHYILNSEGPVDLEVPNVWVVLFPEDCAETNKVIVLLGMGRDRRIHLSVRVLLQIQNSRCSDSLE